MSDKLQEITQAVVDGDAATAEKLTRQALAEGTSAASILRQALIPGMDKVGKLMQDEEYYIPEVLLSARAMKTASDILKPLIQAAGEQESLGRVVIGTVRGDLHDIGKNLVVMMLEGAGFEVVDLGINISPEQFVDKAVESKADIIGLSALLTTTMVGMRDVVDTLKKRGLRDKIKVMIGGAPVTKRFADEIGADGYAMEAASATEIARKLAKA